MGSEESIALTVAIIGALATILSVYVPYVLKKREGVGADIRQKKQERYDELVEALTGVVKTLWTNEKDMDAFILAYNKTSAYASDEVVDACQAFFTLLIKKEKDNAILTPHINKIYNAIRKDTNPKAKSFKFQLYVAESTSQQSQP